MDVGLLALALGLVLVLLGSASLRAYDAPELDPRPILLPVYLLRSLARLAVAYVPARRALRVDPMRALRYE